MTETAKEIKKDIRWYNFLFWLNIFFVFVNIFSYSYTKNWICLFVSGSAFVAAFIYNLSIRSLEKKLKKARREEILRGE